MTSTAAEPNLRRSLRTFFDHPRGLAYLAFTEAWERFSFFGMQTLLVLYMVGQLLKPGHIEGVIGFGAFHALLTDLFGELSTVALASSIYGLYSGSAYLMPLLGGYLGDRVFGQHRCVMAGAILMAIGHFMMAFEAPFLIALLTLICGSGLLKGNISTQVGSLYAAGDRRRTDAFVIFNFGVNVGVVLAPLICGTLGELYGFHYGFAAAGIGMLIGVAIYHAGRRYLPPDRRSEIARGAERAKLQPGDGRVIAALLVVLLVVTSFLVAANELGNIYMLWIKKSVDRSAFGLTVPVTWFSSFTALPAVVLPPFLLAMWQSQARRGVEPGMLGKLGIGCGLCAAAFVGLAGLAWIAEQNGTVAWPWLLLFHLTIAISYLHIWPVGLALFTRAAPAAATAMIISIYFLSEFLAHNIVGRLGSLFEKMPASEFWALHVAAPASGMLIIVIFGRPLSRVLFRGAAS